MNIDFKTLDEIISYFELKTEDAEEVKRELKNIIKKVHPDKNRGEFKTEEEKNLYYDIQTALKFLDEKVLSTSIATKSDITALTIVLKELALTRKGEVDAEIISQRGGVLTTKLQDSIDKFHKQHSTPKITGLVVTVIITALWAFPNVVKDHPLLSFLYRFNKEFTIIWLLSLFILGFIWLRIKTAERKDEEIKQNYKLESTQNYIFSLFIKWMEAIYKRCEIRDNKKVVTFCKDDLISFLITRYEPLRQKLKGTENLSDYEIAKKIWDFEENGDEYHYQRKRSILFTLFKNIFPVPGEINMEIAQIICDLIIDRLNAKEVILKLNEKKLSDFYEYMDDI